MKKLSNLLSICIIFFTLTNFAHAQIILPTVAETLASSTTGTVHTMNCDMVECPMFSNQLLKAIAWDEASGSTYNTNIFIELNGTPIGSVINIPNGVYPDIVIGDNLSNPGNEYIVAVVYMIYGNPTHTTYIQTYNVDLNALTVTPNPLGPVQMSSTGANVKYTHIDLFADNINQIAGLPSLHKFVACWEGTIYNAVIGDINNITSFTATFLPVIGASDVAACTDASNNDYACFVYGGTTGGVEIWDVTGSPIWSSSPTMTFAGDYPRIEAMNLYGGTSYAMFMAVGSENIGTGTRINYASDLASGSSFTGTYAPVTSTPEAPAIAAGVGIAFGNAANIGNSQYTYDFNYIFTPSDILAQDLDISTSVPASITTYWQVNNSATPILGGGPYAAHAISSSSNSGLGLLTAYTDGSNVYYKVTSLSTFGFKTTTVNKIDNKTGFSVYPNPASDYINVNAPAGSVLTIMDVTGKQYIQTISTGKSIDIKDLPAGLYLVKVNGKSVTETLKFTKN